jgi:hypothetical protein
MDAMLRAIYGHGVRATGDTSRTWEDVDTSDQVQVALTPKEDCVTAYHFPTRKSCSVVSQTAACLS